MGYRKRTVRSTGEFIDEGNENMPEDVSEVMPENTAKLSDAVIEEDAVMKRKLEIAEKRRASLALARSKIIPKSQLKKQVAEATKEVENVIKGKDEVIRNKQEETDAMRLKYEKERVKQLEDSLITLQKLIAERPQSGLSDPSGGLKPSPVAPVPVEPEKPKYKRPSRAKSAMDKHDVPVRQETTKQPQHITPKKSIEPRMIAPAPSTETLIDKSYGEQLQERLRTQAINRIMNDTFGGF
jgi:hypothetical protein